MNLNNKTAILNFLLLVSALLASTAHALSTDKEQPIEITADKVQINNSERQSTYSGNVELVQGSLKITGRKLVVKTDKYNNLKKVDVHGTPATLNQKPDKKEEIDAKADHIEIIYNADEEIILNKNASLTQGANKFFGDKIKYIGKTDQVIADSQKDTRVKVVISPKSSPKIGGDTTDKSNKQTTEKEDLSENENENDKTSKPNNNSDKEEQ